MIKSKHTVIIHLHHYHTCSKYFLFNHFSILRVYAYLEPDSVGQAYYRNVKACC